MRIGIVGGGIAGLATAIACRRVGHDVTVFEQSRALADVGAGIQMSPNASRLLRAWGVADRLGTLPVRPEAVEQRRWEDGRVLYRMQLADEVESAFGAPYHNVHRADLVSALVATLGAEYVHVAARVTDVKAEGTVHLDDGMTLRFDAVVGADGIHSVVRRCIVGDLPSRFSGHVAYRALVDGDAARRLGWGLIVTAWMGPRAHLVTYYVRGAQLMNIVAIVEDEVWTEESWSAPGDPASLCAAFSEWAPDAGRLLSLVDSTFRWALHDRLPLDSWGTGRATLVGDACHPMLPYVAQGGAMAIEDAAVLAAVLEDCSITDVPAALARYESIRRQRTSDVQAAARSNAVGFHLPDGPDQEKRDAMLATMDDNPATSRLAWIYGHDARELPTT